MRFWGKTKYSEKKTSREKLVCGPDYLDGDYGDTGPLLREGANVFNIIQVDILDVEILLFLINSHWGSTDLFSLPHSRSGKHVASLQP